MNTELNNTTNSTQKTARKSFFSSFRKVIVYMIKSRHVRDFVTVAVAFSLLISVSVAWFASNKSARAQGMAIELASSRNMTSAFCYALKYDDVNGMGVICTAVDRDTVIDMKEYDNIFRDKNDKTSLIFCVELGNVPDTPGSSIAVSIPCTQPFFENEQVKNVVSNVCLIKIGCEILPDADQPIADRAKPATPATNAEAIFTRQTEAFASVTGDGVEGRFVDKSVEPYVKENTIELSLPYETYASALYKDTDIDDTVHMILYIFVSYDEDLMDYYVSNMGELEGGAVEMPNDFGTIRIQEEESSS